MEIVEYKSPGHPDTLTDLAVESCANLLENYYTTYYGHVLHYNVDKALFLAGDVRVHYGGGEVIKNPCFILGGQVSRLNNVLRKRLANAVIDVVGQVLPNLKSFDIEIRSSNVSGNLDRIAKNKKKLCNDSSFGCGYYPLSKSEQLVKDIACSMTTILSDKKLPIWELFKILLTPKSIIVSSPLYAKEVRSCSEYRSIKKEIQRVLSAVAGRSVVFNPDFELGYPYLTLCGSSIECGDDGQVGRGNRFNGLITPCRPMTLEAFHGKNNQTHIGKLYQKQAHEEARRLYKKLGKAVEVFLVGKIG